ncbi:carboxypeptidase-like regulatory domain-containing protein [Spongiivirga sp. MCCC 1A20706]|uniref:carboxypeptidase-like regulatory domain-containing protein n=1 Tax=Spongiivirga sp. MCCC 1A20706 TaxID=3160963 RepID=UPI00397777B2
MKGWLTTLFLLNVSLLIGQTIISGTVFDEKTNEPLEGVSVYFDGSTFGVITNPKGYFELPIEKKINSPLVISYLGYSDIIIENPYNKENWKIYLKEKAIALKEVVLKADPFTRAAKLKAFKQQFLGDNINGRSCTILNEDDIWLSYDVTTNKLLASSEVPIIIQNKYLGYEHRFALIDFMVRYNRRTLSPLAREETYYVGTSFYIDKQKDVFKYQKRRDKTYQGSVLHLMRTLRDEDYENQKFKFFKGGFKINPTSYIKVIPQTLNTKVILPEFTVPILYKNKRSDIIKRSEYIIIDGYGNFSPPSAIYFSGDLGSQRVGNMLPLDYSPKD